MTVSELIAELKALPADAHVILQKDSGGSDYSPLAYVDSEAVYVPDSTWRGTVYSTDWTADDACMDDDDWADILGQPRCVVLSPVN